MEQKQTTLDIISSWREELAGYWGEMQEFSEIRDVEIILRKLSAYSSRAGYMHFATVRSPNQQVNNFRTKEVDKFLEGCEMQFRIFSRIAAVNKMEMETIR